MTIRTFALGSVAAVAFASLLSAAPASAFTHHPATPEEIQQTDALNAQALATAQGGPTAAAAPAAPTASTAAMPSAPEVSAARPANAAVTPLTAMATPPTLTNAAVQASDGAAAGMVKNVVMGADGKPSVVDVALTDNSKVVAIAANDLGFDATNHVLVASLTNEQIKSLPAAG